MPGPYPDHILAQTIEVALYGTQEGSQRINVWHYKNTSGITAPSVAQLLEIGTNFWSFINVLYTGLANINTNFEAVVVRDLQAVGANVATYTIPQPHPGTQSGTADPANASLVISWRTGRAGRAYRGRTYLFGLSEASTVGSMVNSTYLTNAASLGSLIRNFTNSGGAISLQFGVASFTKEVIQSVIAHIVDVNIDSMRRRLITRGR